MDGSIPVHSILMVDRVPGVERVYDCGSMLLFNKDLEFSVY
jgi:hypothetical protein